MFGYRPSVPMTINLYSRSPLSNGEMAKVMPSYGQIRDRIDAIGETFSVKSNKWLPKSADDEQYKMAFRFQLLTAARISEVCGPYLLRKADMFEVEFNGVPALLFCVRTAKRKGKPRPSAVPLDPKYEPWAKELRDYIRDGPELPFKFHNNLTGTSKRYLMWAARQTFVGLEWPMIEYTRSVDIPYEKDQIIKERYTDLMYPEYLVEIDDETRAWTTSTETIKKSVKVYDRWKPVTSHVMRKRRARTLAIDYAFDGIDLAYYGGWTEQSQSQNIPAALKHYLHADIQEAKENIGLLKRMANRYFSKLLKPFVEIEKPL